MTLDLNLAAPEDPIIYKMHGAVDRTQSSGGQYVITEDDYIEFLARMTRGRAIPNCFAEAFQTRHFLFLGYGLYDWNLRVVLNHIEKQFRSTSIVSWAIPAETSPLERALWQRRNVQIFNLLIDDFIAGLMSAGPRPGGGPAATPVPPPPRSP